MHIFRSIEPTYFGRSDPLNVHNVRIYASKKKDSNRKAGTSVTMGKSTISMNAFCAAHSISTSTLIYRSRQYGVIKGRRRNKAGFVELTAPSEIMPAGDKQPPFAELHFDNGTRLVIQREMPAY